MGIDGITDMLNIVYYAGNYRHNASSDSQIELQDTYVRLDRQLASLISSLELRLGAKNVLFIVTSTGYSDEEEVDYGKYVSVHRNSCRWGRVYEMCSLRCSYCQTPTPTL